MATKKSGKSSDPGSVRATGDRDLKPRWSQVAGFKPLTITVVGNLNPARNETYAISPSPGKGDARQGVQPTVTTGQVGSVKPASPRNAPRPSGKKPSKK